VTSAPLESATVPVIVALSCASAAGVSASMAKANQTAANPPFVLTPDLCHAAEKNWTMRKPIAILLSNYVLVVSNRLPHLKCV
jgi:hypothetical protein